MIQELLEAAITEVVSSKFEITEFQLGKGTYEILKSEVEQITYFKIDIQKINAYRGIPVRLHNSEGAVMYCLKLKNK